MFGSSFRLFRVRGIDVSADISWLLIVGLVSWSFFARFTVWYDRRPGVALIMALSAAVLFFASVVIHELAHALEAQHRGVHVEGISLFIFGGATKSRFDVKRPIDEFALTAVGPYSSLVLGCLFGLASVAASGLDLPRVAEVAGSLGWLNVALAVFNLLPGAPLDGGRILRAIVWKVTGDRNRAIVVAANAGRVLGVALIAFGLIQLFTVRGFGGIWLAVIGWFLLQAATAERLQTELEGLLAGQRAERFAASVETIPASTTVSEAIELWFLLQHGDVFLVEDDGEPLGVIDIDSVRRVEPGQRASTTIGQITRPIGEMRRIDADAPARELVDAMAGADGPVVVMRDSKPAGLVAPDQFQRRLLRLRELEPPRGMPAGGVR